jgi:hypothetical protein
MVYRGLIGAVALTSLSMSIGGAQEAEHATYPDWKGRRTRFVVRGLPGQPSHNKRPSRLNMRRFWRKVSRIRPMADLAMPPRRELALRLEVVTKH